MVADVRDTAGSMKDQTNRAQRIGGWDLQRRSEQWYGMAFFSLFKSG